MKIYPGTSFITLLQQQSGTISVGTVRRVSINCLGNTRSFARIQYRNQQEVNRMYDG